MPMTPIDPEAWAAGSTVYEVTSRSGNYLTTKKGTVVKLSKTRVAVLLANGATVEYYDRGWKGVLSPFGSGQHTWSSTTVNLYPEYHADLPAILEKAKKFMARVKVENAAKRLTDGVNADAVNAMQLALEEWKAINMFGDDA